MATLESILARGVAEGIITNEQAAGLRGLTAGGGQIREQADSAAATPTTQSAEQPSLVVEALGYLGGIIVLVGVILVASQFWPELGDGGKLAIILGVAVAFLVAGALVPPRLGATGTRLRAVLCALSVAALVGASVTFFYGVLDLGGLDSDATVVPPLIAGIATVYALALWWWHPSTLQLALGAAGTAVTVALTSGALGLPFQAGAAAVLVVGVGWIGLGCIGAVRPSRAAIAFGALITLAGGLMFGGGGASPIWALLVAALLVALSVYLRDLIVLGIGSLGVLMSLPVVIYDWFPSVAAAAVSLIVVGGLLVVAALYTARRRAARG